MNPEQIKIYILSALVALIALTVHEVCHGYAAYRLGDSTAKNLGRLTLNPLRHLDPIGTLCMVLFKFGWAKPVPINPRNFKNPKRDFALTALAGPLSNIILGFFSAGLFLLANALLREATFTEQNFSYNLASNLLLFLYLFYSMNIGFGLFNLLPIPPFDGSRLVHAVLPEKIYFGIMKYERQIYFATLAWLLVGDFVASAIRMIPLVYSSPLLYTLAGVFSLSGMISKVIDFVGGLILSMWQIIPFLKL